SDGEARLRMLMERSVDGLVLAAPGLEQAPYVLSIVGGRIPTVALQGIARCEFSSAGTDQVRIGELATGHMVELGRRRIAAITGRTSRYSVGERQRGYEAVLRAVGIEPDVGLIEHSDWEIDGG